MTKTASPPIKVARHFEVFIEDELAAGRYATRDAVVEAGLRLLEEREAKIKALRAAIEEGEASGPAEPFDLDEFLVECRAERQARGG
ncbi:MAG: type II toxin-antitoxin system ParD family antitoxin [Hyphomonadaceae bacterium]|nr:MAG: hypothetical protein FD160_643 [Caulobacteraceae bacterium]MBT9444694.1 type II toxin-antitoxin system ParD family antitoxin [Hyphomonadaceae bacterium]TPW08026.1 MAG: hypothetical protein FD124_693 [Alphaproteobacteria bacterium]